MDETRVPARGTGVKLIPELDRLQSEQGHLREGDLRRLSRDLAIPLYRIEEVVSFYPHFRTEPRPDVEVEVCRDLSCWLADGGTACGRVRDALAGTDGIEVREVSCLGRCELAPAALVNGFPVSLGDHEAVVRLAREPGLLPANEPADAPRDWRIDPYAGGPDADRAAAEALEPYAVYRGYRGSAGPGAGEDADAATVAESIISDLQESGLRGMGGAGFPTGRKWSLVRGAEDPVRYVICNADESEPGTFKDRVILEELPHLVIEGMCLAGLAIGASRGWIYLRHEYERERVALERELDRARELGILGDGFELEIFLSPGGYILGEETALLEAMEDRRGEPRNKPPYPGQKGLEGRPTLINNVETLAMVPAILHHGADWWKAQGMRGHEGLKFMSVSGHVVHPDVYEIPMGTTVSELIERAGGLPDGRSLKAFAPGGASSDFLPAEQADVEIDFESIQEAGSMLGAGALVVLAEGTDMVEAAANVVRFFRNESCGKCVPCRVGTEKVTGMLEAILGGDGNGELWAVLPRLEQTLAETSICGLGQVALNPLRSALRHWGEELDARLARALDDYEEPMDR